MTPVDSSQQEASQHGGGGGGGAHDSDFTAAVATSYYSASFVDTSEYCISTENPDLTLMTKKAARTQKLDNIAPTTKIKKNPTSLNKSKLPPAHQWNSAQGRMTTMSIAQSRSRTDDPPSLVGIVCVVAVVGVLVITCRKRRHDETTTTTTKTKRSTSTNTDDDTSTSDSSSSSSSSPKEQVESILEQAKLPPLVLQKNASTDSSLMRVLDIFPHADVHVIKRLLLEHGFDVERVTKFLLQGDDDDDNTHNNMILGATTTTTTTGDDPLRRRARDDDEAEGVQQQQLAMEAMWEEFNFMSSDSFQPSYIVQATQQLRCDFPFLNVWGAIHMLNRSKNHYAIAHDKLLTAIRGGEQAVDYTPRAGAAHTSSTDDGEWSLDEMNRYKKTVLVLSGRGLDEEQIGRVVDVMRAGDRYTQRLPQDQLDQLRREQHSREQPTPSIESAILMEEIVYVQHKLSVWTTTVQMKLQRAANRRLSRLSESTVDCGCCYEDFPFEEMITCEDGHLFCTSCLKSFVENLIHGSGNLGIDPVAKQPTLQLQCFHADGNCQSGFPRAALKRALPSATLQKHDEIQIRLSIAAAELKDLCSCPKCGYRAVVPISNNSDDDRGTRMTLFDCPVEGCKYKSCAICGEKAHYRKTCQEAALEHLSKGRVQVEEAITEAKVRRCPKCHKAIIKSEGCNKVRCACGNTICYICRKSIKCYSHFCQTALCSHKDCGGCPLFSKNQEADDEDAMRNAGTKARNEFLAQHSHKNGLAADSKKPATVTPNRWGRKNNVPAAPAGGSAFGFINNEGVAPTTASPTATKETFDPLKNLTPNTQQRKAMQLSQEQMQAMAYQQQMQRKAMQLSQEQMQAMAYQQQMMMQAQQMANISSPQQQQQAAMMMQAQQLMMQQQMAAMAMQQQQGGGAGGMPGTPLMTGGAPGMMMRSASGSGAGAGMAPPGGFSFAPRQAKKDDKKFDFVKDAMTTEKKK